MFLAADQYVAVVAWRPGWAMRRHSGDRRKHELGKNLNRTVQHYWGSGDIHGFPVAKDSWITIATIIATTTRW